MDNVFPTRTELIPTSGCSVPMWAGPCGSAELAGSRPFSRSSDILPSASRIGTECHGTDRAPDASNRVANAPGIAAVAQAAGFSVFSGTLEALSCGASFRKPLPGSDLAPNHDRLCKTLSSGYRGGV